MQQLHVQQRLVDLTNAGQYVELEEYIRTNQISQSIFNQSLLECIKIARDCEEHVQCIQQILKQSIDINYRDNLGCTALVYATKNGIINIINEILKYKEKIDKKQIKQALDIAIQSKQDNWDIVETIIKEASLDKLQPHHLIQSLNYGNFKTAQKIIEKYGASGCDENGDTALHVASRKGNLELIKLICQKESLYQKKNKLNQTPIDVACNEDIRKFILEEQTLFQKSPNRKRKQDDYLLDSSKSKQDEQIELSQKNIKIPQKKDQETQFLQNINHFSIQTDNKQYINIETQTYPLLIDQSTQTIETQTISLKEKKFTQENLNIIKDDKKQLDQIESKYITQPFYDQLAREMIKNNQQQKLTLDDIIKQLTFEINTFSQELNKYVEEQRPIVTKIVSLVEDTIQLVLPNCKVQLYGSCYTGLNLIDSDIDLVIESNDQEIVTLHKLADKFKSKNFIQEIKVIENAKTPVLKMQCSRELSGKQIDISLSRKDHSGRRTANSMVEFQKEFKSFKSLALILKFYFKSIGLLNAYQGGLNSYCILTMTLALLQVKRLRETENDEIGRTFLEFFEFYSQDIDFFSKIINIIPPKTENMHVDEPNIYQQFFPQFDETTQELVILDLYDKQLNIASSTFKIKQIKNALILGYSAILNSQKCQQPCFFSRYNKPVCCILKQMIQQSKNNYLNGNSTKQPFYYFFQQLSTY